MREEAAEEHGEAGDADGGAGSDLAGSRAILWRNGGAVSALFRRDTAPF